MKYLVLSLFLLAGCYELPSRSASMIGNKTVSYKFHCIKERSDLGFTSNLDLVVTSSCEISRCVRIEKTLGKNVFSDTTKILEIVNDNLCLEK